MNKRPGFIITVIVFIAALVGFYVYLKKQQNPDVRPINAVPMNAALVIELKKPDKFFRTTYKKNVVLNQLKSLGKLSELNEQITRLDTLFQTNDKVNKLFKDKSLLLSVHDIGKNEFHPLFAISLSGRFEANQVFKSIEGAWGSQYEITSDRYNQVKVYKITKKGRSFFYAYNNGLLLGSSSELLIEDAIRQAESEHGLLSDNGLNRLMETAGDHSEANIYIQFEYFQKYLSTIFSSSYLDKMAVNQVSDWIELDLNAKSQTILLNGFSYSNSDEKRLTNLFKGQNPQQIKFLKFIPVEAESFLGYGLSNYSLFVENLKTYMDKDGQLERFIVNRKKVEETFGKNIEQDLSNIFAGEVAQITMPNDEALVYIKTEGYRDAKEFVEKALIYYCANFGGEVKQLKQDYVIDNESIFPIYKLPLDYLPARLFGPQFKNCEANFVTVFDDYIILGDTYKSLSKVIYNNVLQKTLAYDGAFTQYANFLATKVNFFGFMSLVGTGNNIEHRLTSEAYAYYKKHKEALRNFYAVGWQFSNENKLCYNNLLIRYQPSNTLKAATEWETRLDTVISLKPELMVNHYTKEKEILVQDEKHNIYLINRLGRVLWKTNIDGAIMGEVFQVDYYKNGKLQYLFNTNSKIYLLDRNGNFVERYPVKLPDKAVAPLAVFDYDKRKNYRLFVPLANKKVIAYNIEGKHITGFAFSGTDNEIIAPVQYVRNNNKDYIIVTDKSRIYLLDRQGNIRANPKIQFKPSKNNIFAYQSGNSNRPGRLVRTDSKGTIYYVYFDGKVEEKNIIELSEEHFFAVEDVTGDRINDFVFVDENMLYVYGLTGNKLFKTKFSSTIKHAPAFYRFSSAKNYIGITEADEGKIFLIDGKGNIADGFPLPGKTRFSIGFLEPGSGRFNLIVGGNEYYLYNFNLN